MSSGGEEKQSGSARFHPNFDLDFQEVEVLETKVRFGLQHG